MVMNSNKYSGTTKSLAASVLSQSEKADNEISRGTIIL